MAPSVPHHGRGRQRVIQEAARGPARLDAPVAIRRKVLEPGDAPVDPLERSGQLRRELLLADVEPATAHNPEQASPAMPLSRRHTPATPSINDIALPPWDSEPGGYRPASPGVVSNAASDVVERLKTSRSTPFLMTRIRLGRRPGVGADE